MASKFVISPEPFIQKCKSLAKAKDLHVDVKDGSIRLAWSAFSDDELTSKVEYINRAEAVRLGIPYDLLQRASAKRPSKQRFTGWADHGCAEHKRGESFRIAAKTGKDRDRRLTPIDIADQHEVLEDNAVLVASDRGPHCHGYPSHLTKETDWMTPACAEFPFASLTVSKM